MPRREASRGTSPADISTVDLQPPGLGDNECLLSKLPLWGVLLWEPELTNTGFEGVLWAQRDPSRISPMQGVAGGSFLVGEPHPSLQRTSKSLSSWS